MRSPSLKTMQEVFPQSELALLQSFKTKAATSGNWRVTAQSADKAIEGYGINFIRCPMRGLLAVYVNTGDTYTPTLMLNLRSPRELTWRITTLGDFVDSFQRRYGRNAAESLSCCCNITGCDLYQPIWA